MSENCTELDVPVAVRCRHCLKGFVWPQVLGRDATVNTELACVGCHVVFRTPSAQTLSGTPCANVSSCLDEACDSVGRKPNEAKLVQFM